MCLGLGRRGGYNFIDKFLSDEVFFSLKERPDVIIL